jgi:uncharacterized protein YndB with AHSA1/START domain
MTDFKTTRQFSQSPAEVFAAISSPERLARWWGPAGFTNTFETCDFTPGGTWKFTMHGPDGSNHPNESVFAEIQPDRLVVIQHISSPKFRLVVELTPDAGGTSLAWTQSFDDPKVAAAVRHIVEPANEQNLDRLAEEIA